jgi:hypothetical protein
LIDAQIGVVSEAFAQEMEIVKEGQFKKNDYHKGLALVASK